MVFLVGKIDIDEWMQEQHARILQARRLGGSAREMQDCAAKVVESIHLEGGSGVHARPRFASTRTLARLRVGG